MRNKYAYDEKGVDPFDISNAASIIGSWTDKTADDGKTKLTQGSIGLGYAYNWVPARGWLINVMAMPTLALYNRTTLYDYTIYYISDKETVEEAVEDPDTTFELEDETQITTPNKVTWNLDARVAMVYNWQRTYLRVFGHFNRFTYGSDITWGRLYDWKIYAAFGFRF